jgi:hypothetical protein
MRAPRLAFQLRKVTLVVPLHDWNRRTGMPQATPAIGARWL